MLRGGDIVGGGGRSLCWSSVRSAVRHCCGTAGKHCFGGGRRRRPTVFFHFSFMIGKADGSMDEVVKTGSDQAKSGGTRR
jgi:hypothetical protein